MKFRRWPRESLRRTFGEWPLRWPLPWRWRRTRRAGAQGTRVWRQWPIRTELARRWPAQAALAPGRKPERAAQLAGPALELLIYAPELPAALQLPGREAKAGEHHYQNEPVPKLQAPADRVGKHAQPSTL
ncbi:MAG: hypothetical protein DME25_00855 [Verrucomicrobia bacterium]|nr:MAG: hypothetical protein DME25_00855 [Verrucomicrobiota bacterium]